jgi:hypothetical protein
MAEYGNPSAYAVGAAPAYEGDLVATTLNLWSPKIYDNWSANIPFLKRLRACDHVKLEPGGKQIMETLRYQKLGTRQYYPMNATVSGTTANALNFGKTNTLMNAVYDWSLSIATVLIQDQEEWLNENTQTRMHALKASKLEDLELEMIQATAVDIWQQSTDANSPLTAVPTFVADAPATGTVGGIDAASATWWRNKVFGFKTQMNLDKVLPTPDQMNTAMTRLYMQLVRGGDKPTVIFASTDYYEIYEAYCKNMKRINDKMDADGSFTDLSFKGIKVFFDQGIAAQHMYMLNENYFWFKIHKNVNFKVGKPREPYDKLFTVYPMMLMGNITCGNRALQGVINAL